MAQIKAVPEPTPDPKLGVPRTVSGAKFPYYNLDLSVQVAKAIYDAGGAVDRIQLASLLGYKGIDNGSFLTRVTASKLFGLIEQEGNQIRVSARGRAIVAPILAADKDRALVDAFLAVELFRKVFEEYNGQTLPPIAGLRNLILTKYTIVRSRVAPTVTIMLDSADQAGLFKMSGGNRTKMVKPILSSSSAAIPEKPGEASAGGAASHDHRGGGGGGGKEPPEIPAAILGLLKRLPAEGSVMSAAKRAILVDAFTSAVKYLYPEEEE